MLKLFKSLFSKNVTQKNTLVSCEINHYVSDIVLIFQNRILVKDKDFHVNPKEGSISIITFKNINFDGKASLEVKKRITEYHGKRNHRAEPHIKFQNWGYKKLKVA